MKTIMIEISDGVLTDWKIPKGTRVLFKNVDTDSEWHTKETKLGDWRK